MPLSEQHQLLLQGEVDGHLTDEDRRAAAQLLAEPTLGAEAAAYVAGLRALRAMVQKHAQVKASPLMASRVLAALEDNFDDVSRPVQNKAGARVHKLPVVRLSTMLMASAAALLVCVGLIFGPSLWQGSPQTTTIADEHSKNTPAESSALPAVPKPADPAAEPDEQPRVNSDLPPVAENTRQGGGDGGNDAGNDAGNDKGDTGKGTEGSGETHDDKNGAYGRNVGTGGGLGRRDPAKGSSTNRASRGKAAKNEQGIYVLRLDRGVSAPIELAFEANRERTVSNVQLSTDILSVAALHGEAKLLDVAEQSDNDSRTGDKKGAAQISAEGARDFTQSNAVEVIVSEEALVGLLAALSRLGSTQEYGSLHVPEDLRYPTMHESAAIEQMIFVATEGKLRYEIGRSRLSQFLPRSAHVNELRRLSEKGNLKLSLIEDLVQRESLKRELESDTAGVAADVKEEDRPEPALPGSRMAPDPSRKLRLVIQLQ
jgi:hypothetical protein